MGESANNNCIVILLDSRELGGIETHVYHLTKALMQQRLPVQLWFYKKYDKDHPIETKLTDDGIPTHYLAGSISSLYRQIKTQQPLLIHTHGYKAGIFGRLTGVLLNIPVVSTFHNGDVGTGLVRVYTSLDKITSYLSYNIAVSDEIARRLGNRATVVNNFIELPPKQSARGSSIGFVGRLSHEKGPDLFLKIAAENQDLPFKIFGSGPMEQALKATQPNNVQFMGQVSDMQSFWDDIGLLCISSREEGLPMVALEAMARGIPVAAFRVGGLPKLIEHNVNGWIAPKNNTEVLSRLIQHWSILSSAQRRVLSDHCYKTVLRHHSYEAIMPRVISLYQKKLGKRGLPWPFPIHEQQHLQTCTTGD